MVIIQEEERLYLLSSKLFLCEICFHKITFYSHRHFGL